MPKKKSAPKLNCYILLDRSGSMAVRWLESLSAIDSYVKGLEKDGEATKITLATFDSDAGKLCFDIFRDRIAPKKWKRLSKDEATPRGMTPLYDAVGKIVDLASAEDEKSTVIIIMTDGAENNSREITQVAAKKMLDKCRKKGWQVIFLGADFDNFSQAADLGNNYGQTINTVSGSYGATMDCLAVKTSSFRSSGASASLDFDDDDRSVARGEKK